MSMFPALRRGGVVSNRPSSAGATPITPQNGSYGIEMRSLKMQEPPSRT